MTSKLDSKKKTSVKVKLPDSIPLSLIAGGCPGISKAWGRLLAEAAAHCLDYNNHCSGITLSVQGDNTLFFRPTWKYRIDNSTRASWNDSQEMTEYGACGVAAVMILRFTKFTIIRRARKGEGVDYWLSEKTSSVPFEDSARLEVSGIISGNSATLQSRLKQKRNQTRPTDGETPAIIAVVEFGLPMAHLEQK